MFFRRWFLLIFLVYSTGCIPFRFTTRPGVSGGVLDQVSEKPIADAAVIIEPTIPRGEMAEGKSGFNGGFQLPPKRRWGILILATDVFPFSFSLSIQHPDYQASQLVIRHRPIEQGTKTNIGRIFLHRKGE